MMNIINANALYKEIKKKVVGLPYTRVSFALDGSNSGLNEAQKKELIAIVRKGAKQAEENILKS